MVLTVTETSSDRNKKKIHALVFFFWFNKQQIQFWRIRQTKHMVRFYMKPIEKRRNEILRPSERNSPYGVEMVFNCGSEGGVKFEKGNEQRSYIFLVTAYP